MKQVDEMAKDSSIKSGYKKICKQCDAENRKEWYRSHPEVKKSYYRNHIYKSWTQATLSRHRIYGCVTLISSQELEVIAKNTNVCYICGIKLNWEQGKNNTTYPDSPTLDRTDNENIISIENVRIVCHSCNSTKRNRTFREFVEYCGMVHRRFGELVVG